jgi:hypothetical protein
MREGALSAASSSSGSLGEAHQPSLYAQKRDKKMGSRLASSIALSAGASGAAAVTLPFPRYADPSSFVGGVKDKNSIGAAASSSTASVKSALKPAAPTSLSAPAAASGAGDDGGGACVASTRPLPSAVLPVVQHSNADKVLSGIGVVYQGATDTSTSSSASASASSSVAAVSNDSGGTGAKKAKAIVPPKKILKTVGQAIADWNMIEEVTNNHIVRLLA